MKGIILAGGKGTRLYPSTLAVSKQLLSIYDKPMIYYPLSLLMLSGIKEILIISDEKSLGMYEYLLGDGEKWGLKFSYKVQAEPKGLPEAFIIGEEFIGSGDVALVLGDNFLYGHGLPKILRKAVSLLPSQTISHQGYGAHVFGYQVSNPQDYGVIKINDLGQVSHIEEKPLQPTSDIAVPGVYFFDNKVIEISKKLKPSERGELEITDILREYMSEGRLKATVLGRRGITWLDSGTHETLYEATTFVRTIQKRHGVMISCPEEIAYRMGYITKRQLSILCMELIKSDYGKYLLEVIREQ